MNDRLLVCDEFDVLLPDLLEGALDATSRDAVEGHARDCGRCGALLADLVAITNQAHVLPDVTPSHDLWDGVAARIAAPVVSLPAARAGRPAWRRRTTVRLAAAAVVLVAVTSGLTYMATRAWDHGAQVGSPGTELEFAL